jgi:hypothetical protein
VADLAPIDPALLALLHGQLGGGELTPYARDILLVECHVAGTSHRDLDEVAPRLRAGQVLSLRRDPDNEHDPLAIRVFDADGAELGFVPRAKNEALARLMDAGKSLFGKIESVTKEGRWLRIDIHLYLRDV